MPDVKDVVCAFVRIGEPRDIVVLRLVDVGARTPREHLVRIALMRDIEDDLVVRCVENRVECDGCFDDAEVRTDVTADEARAPDERRTHFLRERPPLHGGVALDVRGAVDGLKIQGNALLN